MWYQLVAKGKVAGYRKHVGKLGLYSRDGDASSGKKPDFERAYAETPVRAQNGRRATVRSLCTASLLLTSCIASSSCDPFRTQFDDVEEAISYRAEQIQNEGPPSSGLRVMTYNIKFAGGRIDFFFDCHGNRVLMDEREVKAHLERLAEKIDAYDPDIVFLQEVDVNSKRSFYIDQVKWLLDHTRLNYGSYASQWKADYVPSDGIGAVDSGNAILSKYPLSAARRIALPLREDQSGLTRYFYLRRNLLVANVTVPLGSDDSFRRVRLVATHAAAYARDGTKQKHIEAFIDQLELAPDAVIAGADLNTVPPGAPQLSLFEDSVCEDEEFVADDYADEQELLVPLYEGFMSAIPLEEFQRTPELHASHTTDKEGFWNRKLDYLFTNLQVLPGSGLTHQDEERGGFATMPLSDHAPVTMELEWP